MEVQNAPRFSVPSKVEVQNAPRFGVPSKVEVQNAPRFGLPSKMDVNNRFTFRLIISAGGLPGQLKEDFIHGGGLKLALEGSWTVEGLDAAVDHHRNTVAILGFVHVVSRYKDGDAGVGSLDDEVPEATTGNRVNATGWFVQEDDARAMDDGYGEGGLLFPAQGEGSHPVVSLFLQLETAYELLATLADGAFGESIDATKESDIFGDG